MKTRSLAYIFIALLMFSCAGGPGMLDEAPDWVDMPLEDSPEQISFRGVGKGDTLALAKLSAIENLSENVLEAMDLGDPEHWSAEGSEAVDAFLSELDQAVRTPEYSVMDGVTVQHKDAWNRDDGDVGYGVLIAWDRENFQHRVDVFADLVGVSSPEFRSLETRAQKAREDGNSYEAALIWAAAAGIAQGNGNLSGFRLALRNIELVLDDLSYNTVSVPTLAFVGLRPDDPVVFSVSSSDRAVGNAEFFITYPRRSRDGSLSTGSARVYSDNEGLVSFRPAEIAFAGVQEIGIAPSADPFLEYLDDSADRTTDSFIAAVETPAAGAEFEALARIRSIPMGILILETDLAGNPLGSDSAARGLLDDLSSDGFDVSLLALNPGEIVDRSERALLRDLKADTRFSEQFERVLHGTVALDSFEQSGDTYTVRVSGTLAMSDINRQVTLYRSDISKSSRAASSQQAINAAFRQLGRSFAVELIEQAP